MVKFPIIRTLAMCTNAAKRSARYELMWNIGFAFLQVIIIALIVLFSRSIYEMPSRVWGVISGGELMIYAASVCGSVLYSLRHNFDGPVPDALKDKVTPLGVFWVTTGLSMFVAVLAYVIRRLGQINSFPVNEGMIDFVSIILFIYSIVVAYVVFSLKHSLASGASRATSEQTDDFSLDWEGRDNA